MTEPVHSIIPYERSRAIASETAVVLFCLAQELEDLRRKYMTKKGPVQKVMGQMRLLSNEDKASATASYVRCHVVVWCCVMWYPG